MPVVPEIQWQELTNTGLRTRWSWVPLPLTSSVARNLHILTVGFFHLCN